MTRSPVPVARPTATEARFWVQLISHKAFAQYMKHRGFSVRTLADAVDEETARQAAHGDGAATSSRALIGHLRSGKRTTCQPYTARAIEKCLDAPAGSLFVPQVSRISQDGRRAA